jgi:Fe2+ or Zn2+ uptake regulation protein
MAKRKLQVVDDNDLYADFETDHLMCRVFTHPWHLPEESTYVVRRGKTDFVEFHLVCSNCGCGKIVPIDLNEFERVHAAYLHPKGYVKSQIEATYGGKDQFRKGIKRELVRRFIDQATAEQKG